MYCPKCGTAVDAAAAFCYKCGTNLRGQPGGAGSYPNQPVYRPRPENQPVYQQQGQKNPAGYPVYQQVPSRQPVFDPAKIPSAQPVHQQAPAPQPVIHQQRSPSAQAAVTPPKQAQAKPAVEQPKPPVVTPPKPPVATPPVIQKAPAEAEEPENVLMGILGAVLGALVGGLSIVLLFQLGYVAAVSGILLVSGTMYGYNKLGKKLSVTGIIICLALVAVTPYFATNMTCAIAYADQMGGSVLTAFSNISKYLAQGVIRRNVYEEMMGQTYLYTFIGVVVSGFSAIKSAKKKK